MGRPSKLQTPEALATLRELVARGIGQVDVARALGWSVALVRIVAKREGLSFVRQRKDRPWTPADVETLWRLAGVDSARQIARKLKRSPSAIENKAKMLGIRRRVQETVTAVAAYLQVSVKTVRRYRKLLNQSWRRYPVTPRGPEDEEVQAIARAILEEKRGGHRLQTSLRRLRRIADGVDPDPEVR